MLKNPQYFVFDGKQRLPFLDAVNVTFVKNKQTAFMQFMAGQYDFFNGIDGSFKNKLLNQNGTIKSDYQQRINAVVTDFLNTEYIGFYLGDTLKGKPNPFRDKHLRKALQLSVNRPEILRFFRNGLGSEAVNDVYGFVPPSLLGEEIAAEKQQENSLSEFQKSEYFKNPQKFAKISLTTTADYLDIAVMLQNTWKKTLNVDVAIELQTGGMLRQLREKGDLGMFRGSWIADYPDAENYLGCFYSPYLVPFGPNYTRFVSKEFDQLYDEISTGIVRTPEDILKRNASINKANQILSDEAPFILLYFDKSLRLMQKNVKGLSNDPINRLDLRRVSKS
jgi:peptide/nickel transport system substrate-binding protein